MLKTAKLEVKKDEKVWKVVVSGGYRQGGDVRKSKCERYRQGTGEKALPALLWWSRDLCEHVSLGFYTDRPEKEKERRGERER